MLATATNQVLEGKKTEPTDHREVLISEGSINTILKMG